MTSSRGRKSKIDNEQVEKAFIKRKDVILLPGGKIVSKGHIVWNEISAELNNGQTPAALYMHVTCNKHNIRSKLENTDPDNSIESDILNTRLNSTRSNAEDEIHTSTTFDSSLDELYTELINLAIITDNISVGGQSNLQCNDSLVQKITLTIPSAEFNKLLVKKVYRRMEKNRWNLKSRSYTVFKEGLWQDMNTNLLWTKAKIKHGFHFRKYKLYDSGEYGEAVGKCKCGSILEIEFDNRGMHQSLTRIECIIKKGKVIGEYCGKRQLKGPSRKVIGKQLQKKSAAIYRIDLANELMETGDLEPPHLYLENAIRKANHEFKRSDEIDRNPVTSTAIMQLTSHVNIIHNLGLNPFFVHYWTKHQLDVYRTYSKESFSCISIDATGGLVRKINRLDKTKSHNIFLYECVIRTEQQQFSVCQLLTESHNTNSVGYWLKEWIRSGAQCPKEVVSDYSRAILGAAVKEFTGYFTVEEYADACRQAALPLAYIRIDVAHFMKKYVDFLATITERIDVKRFYLLSLGQIILCRTVESAEQLIQNILIIARSQYEGKDVNNIETPCEIAKNNWKARANDINLSIEEMEIIEKSHTDLEETFNNSWRQWATNINQRVIDAVQNAKGDRSNAHWLDPFADRLIKDCALLPMWSCIYRDHFGYGRVPASSSPGEGDFNVIKTHLLKNEDCPMRVDDFIYKHVNHINGKMKVVDAALHAPKQVVAPPQSSFDTSTVDVAVSNNQHETVYPIDVALDSVQNRNFPISVTTSMVNMQLDFSEECPACKNGDKPNGAHRCVICEDPVHSLDSCSLPVYGDNEGFGQNRICRACQSAVGKKIIALREIENWRGLIEKKKKSSYLQEKLPDNIFVLHAKLNHVPILKNGNDISLEPVWLGKTKVSLVNTCAFDSLFQLFLVSSFDRPTFKEALKARESHLFFQIVLSTNEKGISNYTHRLRANILHNIQPKSILPYGCTLVQCETTVGDLCTKIFTKWPSLKETSFCTQNCQPRITGLPRIQIKYSTLLLENKYEEKIEREIYLADLKPCDFKDCSGTRSTAITYSDDYLIIETYSEETVSPGVKISKIPKTMKLTFLTKVYKLVGFVNFIPPIMRTPNSDNYIGHYEAISLRGENTWISYNDLESTEKKVSENQIVIPDLLIYMK